MEKVEQRGVNNNNQELTTQHTSQLFAAGQCGTHTTVFFFFFFKKKKRVKNGESSWTGIGARATTVARGPLAQSKREEQTMTHHRKQEEDAE